MSDTERLAFEHAAQLCREYRSENKSLKVLVIALSAALISALCVILGALV